MTRLRVAIDARLQSGLEGGVEQYLIGLAHGLGTLTDGDEEYLFLVYPGQDGWLRPYLGPNSALVEATPPESPGTLSRLQSWAGATMPWVRSAWRWLDAHQTARPIKLPVSDGTAERAGAQLVHFATQRGFLTDLPTIYQPWDLQHLHMPGFFSPAARRWRETTYRAFCARADLVVVASAWAKRDIGHRYDIDPGRIAVVHPPTAVRAYSPPTAEEVSQTRHRHRLPARYLIYPAQTWEHKNHLRLVAAVALLRDRDGVAITVICTGRQTSHYRAIRSAVRRAGLQDQVRFLGFVPPSDIETLYRLSDGLIFPSLFEGWGLPVVEAFSLGVPVASAATTSLPDLVGDAAVLFDPTDVRDIANAMAMLWNDPDLRRTLTERGRRIAQGLEGTDAARLMRDHYRAVAERASRAPSSGGAPGALQ